MHSAIVYAVMPENAYEARQKAGYFLAAVQKLENNKSAHRLGDFVWEINFRESPDALAVFVTRCEQLAVPYGILPLETDPERQWIVCKPTP